MTPEQWFEVIHTNLCSLYNVTQPLFDAMCEQRDARIINISSVNGQKGSSARSTTRPPRRACWASPRRWQRKELASG